MKLFKVPSGSSIKVIDDGEHWERNNFTPEMTTEERVYELNEMRLDPTGIASHASSPTDDTVGGRLARNGWYGFARDGKVILAHVDDVELMQ